MRLIKKIIKAVALWAWAISAQSTQCAFSSARPLVMSAEKERPRIPILQYHDGWVCVNKPPGLTVHRSAGSFHHKFVLSTLLKRQLSRKVYPVHRLDHRTSGAILFAFDSDTCGKLHGSLASANASKQYIALVRGDFQINHGNKVSVDKPLNIQGELKDARTDFTLLASVSGNDIKRDEPDSSPCDYFPSCSLVLCEPKTGRTHQIRRHARSLGHPVLGDTQHGDSKVNRWWRTHRALDRLALHCICLDLPSINGSENDGIKCVAPLSPELFALLHREDMKSLFEQATEKDPRLTYKPIDIRGGSYGRHYKRRMRDIDQTLSERL